MTLGERAVLLATAQNAVGEAIARELRAAMLRVVVCAPSSDAATTGRSTDEGPDGEGQGDLLRGNLSTVAGARELVVRARRVGSPFGALVLSPGNANEHSRAGWERAESTLLKVPFFLARDFGLELSDAGGKLVVVVDRRQQPGMDTIAGRVVSAGLVTMVQGLGKALPENVEVGAVIINGAPAGHGTGQAGHGEVGADDVARAIRFLLLAGPSVGGSIIELGKA